MLGLLSSQTYYGPSQVSSCSEAEPSSNFFRVDPLLHWPNEFTKGQGCSENVFVVLEAKNIKANKEALLTPVQTFSSPHPRNKN